MKREKVPVLTLAVAVVTAVVAGLGFVDPAVQTALRRDPTALQTGAWWRMLSPLLVRTDGWLPLATILVGTVAAGAIVECHAGWWRWLVLYVGSGLVGQAFGYVWDPDGAGSSVAVLGLFAWIWHRVWRERGVIDQRMRLTAVAGISVLAALAGAALFADSSLAAAALAVVVGAIGINAVQRLPASATGLLLGGGGLLIAVVLTVLQDNHGPAVLAGLLIAGLMDVRSRSSAG